jgi:hypothetical protein
VILWGIFFIALRRPDARRINGFYPDEKNAVMRGAGNADVLRLANFYFFTLLIL